MVRRLHDSGSSLSSASRKKPDRLETDEPRQGGVRVRGARVHNLKSVDVDIPRDALVVFTGVSGSGKSSLAFGTLYAEAQRRYLESVSPYARRLFQQMAVPDVDAIEGLPPAVALQQQRGTPSTRSSVGSVTTISNLLRMLYSRAGEYPAGQTILHAEAFSPNTPQGACPTCHGLGRIYDATEASMVPDPSLTIRERAIAAWPPAWQGQNQRDILVTLGYDVDTPWRELPKKDRDWILFTDEQPAVPVFAGYEPHEVRRAVKRKEEPSYQGTFTSARRYVLHTFGHTESAMMKRRVAQYLVSRDCPACQGKRLRPEALAVTFAGRDIAETSRLPLKELGRVLQEGAHQDGGEQPEEAHPEKVLALRRIAEDIAARLTVILDLGLGYLSLERTTPTLSPGELQRLRLATQIHSHLFGVVYLLDEPSAGLHPVDTTALLRALDRLRETGNSLFVVEHDLDVVRHADWIVDVGPGAGERGGRILHSGPLADLAHVQESRTRRHLFGATAVGRGSSRTPKGWLRVADVGLNNLRGLDVAFPLGMLTSVTGVSGSGKSSLVSGALVDLVSTALGRREASADGDAVDEERLQQPTPALESGHIVGGLSGIERLVQVDQRPIGRTPRSNLATYTGLFDRVRQLFASTDAAKRRKYDASRFSFNVGKGRCETCAGEGFVMVELLFLPSVYAPCPTCHGARYNDETLKITYRGKTIADVLTMTVEAALAVFDDEPGLRRALTMVRDVGLGYLRLGQPATELSGGEAQRVKLATELQRSERGTTLYVLDEPTTGLHPDDVERLLTQLQKLVDAGNTVVVVEHDMQVVTASDHVIDIGPGAGDEGGRVVVSGTPPEVAASSGSRTAPFLALALAGTETARSSRDRQGTARAVSRRRS
jgi:excinuclease ABC subunit A